MQAGEHEEIQNDRALRSAAHHGEAESQYLRAQTTKGEEGESGSAAYCAERVPDEFIKPSTQEAIIKFTLV